MKKLFLLFIAALLAACTPSPEKRAAELISKMSIEQKASLMLHPSEPIEELGIPSYNWWNEALHGVARNGKATTFPMPIGMAASFDDDLLLEVFTAVSDEGRVKNRQALEAGHAGWYQGITYWTPNINIFRDPRWGRGMETYGEDPYLTGRMGIAVVRGLQGDPKAKVLKAHACAKHFAVHSGPEWNRHTFNAEVSERDLRETYLPAFKDLVTKAGVQEVMIAYNRFREEPCGVNDYLINTILRGEWGFKGLVVSDCWAIKDIYATHKFLPDQATAAAGAVHTGVDLNCGQSYGSIPEAVQMGILDEADVDRSLERLLAARIRLGELDGNIDPWNNLSDDMVEGPEHLALARKMAQESIVLLQNREALPLDASSAIALIGPNADDAEMMWGNYNPIPEHTVTLATALRERIPNLVEFPACGIVDAIDPVKTILEKLKDVDYVVFAGGISPRFEGEEMPVEVTGFKGGDRTSIELPAIQREILKALQGAGKKVILVNFSGSAMGLGPETESCDAIVQAWYPGEEGGNALADILLGNVAPSGKLPLTFYRSVDDLPDYEDYSMKGRTYRYFEGTPLFAFGHGLSYTTFEYGEATVKGGKLCIPVTNTGKMDADEVVQMYVKNVDDADRPIKSLRGFKRVSIKKGETVTVSFDLSDEVFLSWSEEKQDMVPATKGIWRLYYGGSSATEKYVEHQIL